MDNFLSFLSGIKSELEYNKTYNMFKQDDSRLLIKLDILYNLYQKILKKRNKVDDLQIEKAINFINNNLDILLEASGGNRIHSDLVISNRKNGREITLDTAKIKNMINTVEEYLAENFNS